MANFPGMILTDQGRVLQAKAQTGQALAFTRVALGSGAAPANPEELTALVFEEKTLVIQSFELVGDGTSKMRVVMTNQGEPNGFFIREIGVFARDPDTNIETLYSYSNAGDQPDFLPAAGGPTLVEQVFDIYTVVGTATSVTAIINDAITLATKADIEEIRPYLLPEGGLDGQLIRKVGNAPGVAEWFDPAQGLPIRLNSIEESRIAVANQTVFNLVTTRTNGLAVYVEGVRLRNDEWSAIGATQVLLDMELPAGTRITFVNNEEVGAFDGAVSAVSLVGPNTVQAGQSYQYTITDYDSFAVYEVETTLGTVTRMAEIITLMIPAGASNGALTLTVRRDNSERIYLIAVGAASVNTPEIVSPAQGANNVSPTGPFTTTAFSTTPANADMHESTDWQFSTSPTFATITHQSLADTIALEQYSPPEGALPFSTLLYVRARHNGAALGPSMYSAARQFTTRAAVSVVKPTITDPTANEMGFSRAGPITSSEFATANGTDTHRSSDWQIATDSGFTNIVAQLIGSMTSLTSYTVPAGALQPATEYYVRVRHEGTIAGYSPYSDTVKFTTLMTNTPSITAPTEGQTNFSRTGPFTSSAFSSTGMDTHQSSDWQFSTSPTFATITHQSIGNVSALTSYSPPAGALLGQTTYYARVRHNGSQGGPSAYSAARLFTTAAALPTGPNETTRLQANDAGEGDTFGYAVALSENGNTLIVGARADASGRGSAYVFTRSGTAWTQQAMLLANDAASGDAFGTSVALSSDGNTALIGANLEDPSPNGNNGAAYVFTRSGTTWTQQAKLRANDAAGDQFGVSVSLSSDGNTALIGANLEDTSPNTNNGAAYVFTRSGATWTQQAKLLAGDAAGNDLFGFFVSLSADGNTALIGAPLEDTSPDTNNGAAYVFTRSGTTWTQQAKLLAIDSADNDDQFGISVSLSSDGNTALIGANLDGSRTVADSGAVYVFTRSGTTWTEQAKLFAGDAASNDQFGISVSLSSDGNTALIGASLEDTSPNTNNGAAYVFTRSGTTWTQQAKLLASDAAENDQFGFSVALSRDATTAAIGARLDDNSGGTDAGSVYIF